MAKRNSAFSVRLSGVSEGQHKYDFELDTKFFDGFGHPEISGGKVKAEIILDKKGLIRKLNFKLKGTVSVLCDRCLDYFDYKLIVKDYLVLKNGEDLQDIDEHLIMVPEDLYELDLAQYLFEFIVLNLPLKKIHPDDRAGNPGCNPEMLKKIDEHMPEAENKTTEENDPRWNALKDLLDKE